MVVIAELLMDLRVLGMIEEAGTRGRAPSQAAIEAQYLIPDVLHSISIGTIYKDTSFAVPYNSLK